MADNDGNKDAKNYGIGIPPKKKLFFLKGLDHVDWGIKDRMSRIFNTPFNKPFCMHGFGKIAYCHVTYVMGINE